MTDDISQIYLVYLYLFWILLGFSEFAEFSEVHLGKILLIRLRIDPCYIIYKVPAQLNSLMVSLTVSCQFQVWETQPHAHLNANF